MALPVDALSADQVFAKFKQLAKPAKDQCNSILASLSGGGRASYGAIATLLPSLVELNAFAVQIASDTPLIAAIVSYIQAQTNNPTMDVAGEFNDSLTKLQALIAALIADYPKDANGNLLDRKIDAANNIVWNNTDAAGLPTAFPLISDWLATVAA